MAILLNDEKNTLRDDVQNVFQKKILLFLAKISRYASISIRIDILFFRLIFLKSASLWDIRHCVYEIMDFYNFYDQR